MTHQCGCVNNKTDKPCNKKVPDYLYTCPKHTNGNCKYIPENEKNDEMKDEYVSSIEAMKHIYEIISLNEAKFPLWTFDIFNENQEVFHEFMSSCIVYAKEKKHKEEDIQNLLYRRLPSFEYDNSLMKETFPRWWSEGYEPYFQKEGILAPHIAIYVKGLLSQDDEQSIPVHIINVFPPQLNDIEGPDYRFFFRRLKHSNEMIDQETMKEIKNRYKEILNYIYTCALQMDCTTVILPGKFGKKNPKPLYKSILQKTIYDFIQFAMDQYQIETIEWDPKLFITMDLEKVLIVNTCHPFLIPSAYEEHEDEQHFLLREMTTNFLMSSSLTNPYLVRNIVYLP